MSAGSGHDLWSVEEAATEAGRGRDRGNDSGQRQKQRKRQPTEAETQGEAEGRNKGRRSGSGKSRRISVVKICRIYDVHLFKSVGILMFRIFADIQAGPKYFRTFQSLTSESAGSGHDHWSLLTRLKGIAIQAMNTVTLFRIR